MRRRLAASVLLFVIACGGESPHVARLEVKPSSLVVRHGQCAEMELRWSPLAALDRLEGHPAVFVHLLRGPHNLVRTFDHRLPFDWTPGTEHSYRVDLCQSVMADPLPPGMYNVKLGLYDDTIGYRWPLRTNGSETGRRGYRVAAVVIPSKNAGPRFTFAGHWPDIETVADQQVLKRRLIPREGIIRISGIEEAGSVRIAVRGSEGVSEQLRITTSCSAETFEARGAAVVRIPIAATSNQCEIRFTVPPTAVFNLESLAWVKQSAVSSQQSAVSSPPARISAWRSLLTTDC